MDGQAVYPLEPEPFAEALVEFVEKHHISVVGGCCGTTPAHLKLLVDKIDGRPHPERPHQSDAKLASSMTAILMRQDPPPTLLGERCNAQGSRKFKKMLLEEDYDGILELAREQVAGGAHALDISCAVTERPDEVELMRKVVKKLEMGVDVPLVIDTTELDVLETALKTAPGRCLINSTHLEAGRTKADKIFTLAKDAQRGRHRADHRRKRHGEDAASKKLEVARRIYDIAVNEHGLRPQDLVYDALTFTLATGDQEFVNSAIETIEGIRLIKQNLPGVMASLGVSNLSFGLSPQARPVLNSVMLYHCMQAGLDMAIVNPAQVKPYAEIDAAGTRPGRGPDLQPPRGCAAAVYRIFRKGRTASRGCRGLARPDRGMTPEERLHWSILHRHKEGVEADIDKIIEHSVNSPAADGYEQFPTKHEAAVHILNTVLLPAMKEVGDKFGAGELILPFVLQSAEVMKKSVAHLENYLEKKEGVSKGLVVLATVYGDVHDIGKNLVKTILSNNGYDVIDLGKQVPAETIITKAVEVNATAIGLSALLVSTSKQMPLIINELHRRNLKVPGAGGRRGHQPPLWPAHPVHRRWQAARAGRLLLQGCLRRARDDGPVDRSREAGRTAGTGPTRRRDMEMGRASQVPEHRKSAVTRSNISPEPIAHPLKWGQRVVKDMPLEIVFEHLSLNELYRLSWGAKNTHGAEWEKLKKEFDARLAQMTKDALRERWLQATGRLWHIPLPVRRRRTDRLQPGYASTPPLLMS